MRQYFFMALLSAISISFSFPVFCQESNGAAPNTKLYLHLFRLDSSLFNAFNSCDGERFKLFLSDSLEFYDDRQGLNRSRDKEMESFSNRCKQEWLKVRRELVPGSMKVYILGNFGAVQMGEHLFYETSNGQKEQLSTSARFIHIWQNKDGKWTLSRIVSYDHKAVKI